MNRRPLVSRGYTIINNKTMPGSIGAHFRELHNAMGQKYQAQYTQKGISEVHAHEGQEAKGRAEKESRMH